MARETGKINTDVVVAGSGPGGATVARELARLGKNVTLLERAKDIKWIGNSFSAARMADKMGMTYSEEGTNIIRLFATGGSSLFFCGAAIPPPGWFKSEYGIDSTST